MTCDCLLNLYSGRKATESDIENNKVMRCGKDTDDDYLDLEADGVNYPVDLCKKHKNRNISEEMILKNHEMLTKGINYYA